MSDIFITADEHYGHENILSYCNRPFSSVDEMNYTLIRRHNRTVPAKKSSLTIHVGDMFWRTMLPDTAMNIIELLNGRHAFIYGNHDELIEEHERLFAINFAWIKGKNKENTSYSIHFNNYRLVISHFAQREWQSRGKGSWHVYGHSHQKLPPFGKSFDIGVDGHNYDPWSLEEIEAKMNTLERL